MAERLTRIPIEIYRDEDGARAVARREFTIDLLTATGGPEPTVHLSEVVEQLNRIADDLVGMRAHWLQVEQARVTATLFDNCREQLVGLR